MTLVQKLKNILQELLLSLRNALKKLQLHRPSKKTILLIAAVVAITVIAQSMIAQWLSSSESMNIPSVGAIRFWGVEAYGGDLKTTNGTKTINWGTLYLGASRKTSFTLKSSSNLPIKIAFNITDLFPEGLANYITLKWNYNETTLLPEEPITIEFTLSLSSTTETLNYLSANRVTKFTLGINIYART